MKFGGSGGLVEIGVYGDNGNLRAFSQTMSASETKETDAEVNDITNLLIKGLRNLGFDGKNPGIYVNQTVTILNVKRYDTNAKSDTIEGVVSGKTDRFVSVRVGSGSFNVDYADIKVGSAGVSRVKTQTQTGSGLTRTMKDPIVDKLVDFGFKNVKPFSNGVYQIITPNNTLMLSVDGQKITSVSDFTGSHRDITPSAGWDLPIIEKLKHKAYFWVGAADTDKHEFVREIVRQTQVKLKNIDIYFKKKGFKMDIFVTESTGNNFVIKRNYASPKGTSLEFVFDSVWDGKRGGYSTHAFVMGVGSQHDHKTFVSGYINIASSFVDIIVETFEKFADFVQESSV